MIPVIAPWRFGSPLGLQLPKWELPWECEGSFSHTLLHSWEYKMCFPGLSLASPLASPCFGRKPKVKVATPFYPKSVASQEACPNSLSFHCFHLRLTFESIKEVGNASLIVVMTNVVTIQKKSRSRWDSHRNANHNAKCKGLPWIESKPRPNKPSSLLWNSNDYIDEINWLPSG
jgi:hypothetical protein